MINKLSIKNLCKSYNNRVILKDINFHVKQGEAIGLFGPNGAGKTSLFSIIIGLIKADLGQVLINDQEINNLPIYLRARMGISYLPQESSIFKGLSVEDNIKAVLELNKINKDQIEVECDQLLNEFNLNDHRKKPSLVLSGGERRRLEIARSLAYNPKFILLDEPLAGVDPLAIKDIKKLVSQLKRKNIGVLITDHNVRDTLEIIDRGCILHDGKIIFEGKSKEIMANTQVQEVYLGKNFAK